MAKDIQKLHGLSVEELKNKIQTLQEELFRMRCNLTTGQLADNSQIKKHRRQIAVVKTVAKQFHSINL